MAGEGPDEPGPTKYTQMKLTYKFAIWYLALTLVVLLIGGVISYHNTQEEINKEQARHLRHRIDFLAGEIKKGVPVRTLASDKFEIRVLPASQPLLPMTVSDTLIWHNYLKRKEPEVKVAVSRKINGRHYYISTHDLLVESDDITEAVFKSLSTIFLLFLVVTVVGSLLISRRLLAPFHKTLQAVGHFRLDQNKPPSLPATRTREFVKLNAFVEQMTRKARQDYQTLKTFTENASHELQTPLAIIGGKLELLLNTPMDPAQTEWVVSIHDAVDKLSKMHQSLTLLTKLDNQEFVAQPIDFSQLLETSWIAFQELMEMKQLRIEKEIASGMIIHLHPVLAHILVNNLLSNAIRHNTAGGEIRLRLRAHELVVANTGLPLEDPPEKMFLRFTKSNQSGDSIGLGLSIVQQICENNALKITYRFQAPWHTFILAF